MTEGYMDVIALHKAGFDMTVASMGTALTWAQARQLKNYCDRIYISYDGDTAGQKATMRGLDILAASGLNVRVVRLPEGLDPDDVIRTRGREFYAQLLTEAETLPQFKINSLKKSYDLTDPEGKSKFAIEAIKVIKALDNPVEREEYINLVSPATKRKYCSRRQISPSLSRLLRRKHRSLRARQRNFPRPSCSCWRRWRRGSPTSITTRIWPFSSTTSANGRCTSLRWRACAAAITGARAACFPKCRRNTPASWRKFWNTSFWTGTTAENTPHAWPP